MHTANSNQNFKRITILVTLFLTTVISYAQQITGTVKEVNGNALNGATVSLVKAADSSTVKLAITKTNGTYAFAGIKEGNYKIGVSYVGHRPSFSPVFSYNGSDVTVKEILLTKSTGTLNNITVTVSKPIIEIKADKTILNVEGTINGQGSNALELLRKSPGVLLDKDDNISLMGKNGVQVYVDGRSNPLSGQDLATYLKSLPSSQIEAIELITNPSAKYDAAGNAGIINIKLVKNKAFGTNGSLNGGVNFGRDTKYNGGFSLNHRNKRINIFSTYSYNYAPNEQIISAKRTVADSLFDLAGTIFDLRKSHNFKVGADYFIDKKNTIGVMVNGVLADPTSKTNNKTLISNQVNDVVDRVLKADNNNQMKRHNTNINLNYSHIDPKGKSLTINADRGTYKLNSDQFQRNNYYDPTESRKLNTVIYHMVSPAQININSIKADYDKNAFKGKLSIGGKAAMIKTDNDFARYNVNGASEELDKDRSNHFIYKETINAGYVNYNRQYKKFMFQAGVRVENTSSEGNTTGMKFSGGTYIPNNSSFKRSYTDFFPSAAFTFNKNPKKQWGFTYSRRIDRPAYQDLNPFESKLDEYTFMKGNINLRPQYTNSLGVTHTYKYKLNMSLNYSHVKDLFTQIMDTVEKSKMFLSKRNLATQDIVSLNVSYPFSYKTYSLFTSITSNYSKYQADFGPGRKVDLESFGFNLFAQNSLKFSKTCTAELSGFYNAPTIYNGNFKGRSMYGVDAGLSRQILKGRGTVKASVSDIFHSMKFRATSDFAGQVMKFNYQQDSRQLKLSATYRFGSNTVKAARQRATGAEEELKRAQQSGGGIGN